MKTALISAAMFSLFAVPAGAVTFSNPTPIGIVDGGEVVSDIVVAGTSGTITGLTLTLNGLSHTYPDDLVFGLLNEEAGLGFVFVSGAGGSTDVNGVTLTFSDAAAGFLPESFVDGGITSGTYLPSNYLGYEFTNFDDAGSFAGFSGLSANGTWSLYVLDTFPADTGVVAGGWSLDFALAAVPEPATWGMMIVGFGFAGSALRRRRQQALSATA